MFKGKETNRLQIIVLSVKDLRRLQLVSVCIKTRIEFSTRALLVIGYLLSSLFESNIQLGFHLKRYWIIFIRLVTVFDTTTIHSKAAVAFALK